MQYMVAWITEDRSYHVTQCIMKCFPSFPPSFLSSLPPSITSQDTISDQPDEFQQLVLIVVQREVIPDFKALQVEKFASNSSLCSALWEVVNTLCKDPTCFQASTSKQNFCWGIITSCCEKIPICNEHFEWVYLYKSVITCLGKIYISYCKRKNLPGDKRLLPAEGYPQEVVHNPPEHIKKYDLLIRFSSCNWYNV